MILFLFYFWGYTPCALACVHCYCVLVQFLLKMIKVVSIIIIKYGVINSNTTIVAPWHMGPDEHNRQQRVSEF